MLIEHVLDQELLAQGVQRMNDCIRCVEALALGLLCQEQFADQEVKVLALGIIPLTQVRVAELEIELKLPRRYDLIAHPGQVRFTG